MRRAICSPIDPSPKIARRAGIGVGALLRLAKADAFRSMGLSRREALWAIRGMRNEALPLFAAAEERAREIVPEQIEDDVSLPAMKQGREVVEDYRSHGLSLRPRPLSFLRSTLAGQGISPCSAVRTERDGLPIILSGLVMLRQRRGSAKGAMFITLEDETYTAKLIVWPSLFEQQRRVIMGASMMACRGRVQSVKGVIHVIAGQLIDQSELLGTIGGLDEEAFAVPTGRGDEAVHAGGAGIDSRDGKALRNAAREIHSGPSHRYD